ncbi:hypothetical protein BC628DRAFT_1422254 [Trametes gibbosa]|nr:hypothetical protein BC628DRAFT_1422254 [Trametes gibbosa]
MTPVSARLGPQNLVSLPLGDIKPSGWLMRAMKTQDSLMGKHEGFYQYLSHADTEWVGWSENVYTIEGAGSLWFRDMVTIAGMLELPTLSSQTEQFLDYYLDTQGSDGWLGPEANNIGRRSVSGRFPFLIGAMRVAEAQPARASKIVAALHKFVALMNKMLHQGEPWEEDEYAYASDLLVILQWLYDMHPDGNESVLTETMSMITAISDPYTRWADVSEQVDLGDDKLSPDLAEAFQGMKLAKSLVTLGARTRMSGDQSDHDSIHSAWKDAIRNAGQPLGLLMRDPRLLGSSPGWTHSTVEAMRTSQYLYTLTRDPAYAENVDRVFYGAGQFTHWGQIDDIRLCRDHYLPDGPYYELFKQFSDPSCGAILYPEGKFDFAFGAFLAPPDKTSLLHVHPGPFTVNTTLAGDNRVAVTVDTTYPFSLEVPLTTTIVSQQAFVYYVRIPGGSIGATIAVNGSDFTPCHPTEDGLHAIQIQPGTTNFVLKLPLNIVTETSPSGNVAVSQGPVLFTFDEFQQSNHDGRGRGSQFAIDPSTLAYSTPARSLWSFRVPALPVHRTIVVAARALPSSVNDSEAAVPQIPDPATPLGTGSVINVTLTPYADSVFPRHVMLDFPTFSVAESGASNT